MAVASSAAERGAMTPDRRLDVRVWLLWAVAASVPALLGRNPFVLAMILIVAAVVRAAWMPVAPRRFASWRVVFRVALLFTAIGVLFNMLFVHAGDIVLARIPDVVPVIGGPITLNALVFGVLSGAALVALVLVGTTAGAMLDWPALMRVLPERAAPLAVAGSVAWALLPGMSTAWREIREAQAARGHRPRGVRDLPPLLVPLLDGGLERALTMAEVLEGRGFGVEREGSGAAATSTQWRGLAMVVGVATVALAAYAAAVGLGWLAMCAAALAVAFGAVALVPGRRQRLTRTRYRIQPWRWADTVTAGTAALALVATLLRSWTVPAGLRYEPYPSLTWPNVDVPLLLVLSLLMAPALFVPGGQEQGAP